MGLVGLSGADWNEWIDHDINRPHAIGVWWASRVAAVGVFVVSVLFMNMVDQAPLRRSVVFAMFCAVVALGSFLYFSKRVWPRLRGRIVEQVGEGTPKVSADVKLRR
jgi:hypothetical protein